MSISEKLTTIADNQEKVYEAGKKSQYDEFWDSYQKNGTKVDHTCAFAYWDRTTFKPKYDIHCTCADRMFFGFSNPSDIVDLVDVLEKQGKTMDFTGCTRFYYAFYWAYIQRLGTIDLSASKTNEFAFETPYIQTIEKIIVSEETVFVSRTFHDASLKNINAIEGKIGSNIWFSQCPLTKASITNVVNALSNTTSGLTCTFNKTAKESAFTNSEWSALIETKKNWTFSLV